METQTPQIDLEAEISSYLEREGIVSRTTEEMFSFLSHYESKTSLSELKDVLNRGIRRAEGLSIFFNALARKINGHGFYDYLMGNQKEGVEWYLKKILGEIENPKNVLDVGCATGLETCLIALKYPEAQVTGLDVSPEMLERAKERARKHSLDNTVFSVGDIDVDFKGNKSYDLVICSHVPIKPHPQDLGFYFRRLALEESVTKEGKIIIVGSEYAGKDHYKHETNEEVNVDIKSTSKYQSFYFYGADNDPVIHTFQSIDFSKRNIEQSN